MGSDGSSAPRETSGLTTRLILDYVEKERGSDGVTRLLEVAGVKQSERELRDENRWFSYEAKHRLFDASKEVLDDPRAPYHIGQKAIELRVGVPVILALKAFGSPKRVYQNVVSAAGKFTTTHNTELLEVGDEKAKIRFKDVRGVGIKGADRDYNTGLLSCVPALFGLPFAHVHQTKYVEGPHGYYEYEITWETQRRSALNGLLAGMSVGLALAIAVVITGAPSFLFVIAACCAVLGAVIYTLISRTRVRRRLWRRLQSQLKQQEERQRQLEASLRDLVSAIRIDDLLSKITAHAQAAVAGKEYALLLCNGSRQLSTAHSSEVSDSVLRTLEEYAVGLMDREISEPLAVNRVEEEIGLESLAYDAQQPVGSLCFAPLLYKDEQRGFLVSISDHSHGFLPLDVDQMESYAAQVAVALANAEILSRLEEQASKDPLTGLLNHREFHESVAAEIEVSRTSERSLSLVMLDLDCFKDVNDELGHREGDRLLRAVGECISSSMCEGCLAFRIGGDEFALLLPKSDADEARKVAEKITGSLPQSEPSFSISFGIAEFPADGEVKDTLITAAELALQKAQRVATESKELVKEDGKKRSDRLTRPSGIESAGELERLQVGTLSLEKQHRQLALANRLGSRIARLVDPSEVCKVVVEELHDEFHYYMASMLVLDGEERHLTLSAGSGRVYELLEESGNGYKLSLDKGIVSNAVTKCETIVVDDVRLNPDFRGGEHNRETRSELCAPIRVGDHVWGALNLEEPQVGAFDQDDVALINTIADQIGSVLQSAELYEELENAYVATVEALSGALEAKDRYTATHAREITEMAVCVGGAMGMSSDELKTLRYAALFHDIGKLAIPSEILNKDSKLEEEEFREVAKHTVIGQQILAPVPFLDEVSPLVRHAHERWDGCGYPDGLSGEEIPIGSRIIFVCDAFHAMTSNRPYRKARPRQDALNELRSEAGTQFDPDVVEAFLGLQAEGRFDGICSEDADIHLNSDVVEH